jgi:serine/threonine protein kinase
MALEIGQLIDDKYRIVRLIGAGGMGEVYEGENVRVRLRVAIKVLQQSLATSDDAILRFEREAQASGQIGSDHIMVVYDLGALPNGDRYMVMEYLDGETLAARIQRLGRLGPAELAPIVQQICLGLSAAHGAGIVHRDLKPDNVFITREKAGRADFVKLIDFGISKFFEGSMGLGGGSGPGITMAGAVMGTPFYMSPEQARGAQADYRSDIYSVGVIMYEALSGRVPFSATTLNEILFQIVLASPTPLEDLVPDVDARFANIVARAMAREPDARFTSAASLGQVVASWADPQLSPSSTQTIEMPVPGPLSTPGRGVARPSTPVRGSRPPGARRSDPPSSVAAGHSGTLENWAQSGLGEAFEPPRSRAPWILGSLLLISLLAGGAILFLIRGPASPGPAAASASDGPVRGTGATPSALPAAEPPTPAPTTASTSTGESAEPTVLPASPPSVDEKATPAVEEKPTPSPYDGVGEPRGPSTRPPASRNPANKQRHPKPSEPEAPAATPAKPVPAEQRPPSNATPRKSHDFGY